MKNLTIILPFYQNAGMLAKQIRTINGYGPDICSRLELIVVDDCSPMGMRAEETMTVDPLFDFKLYRILSDLPWNWLQARNLGAKEAAHDWLLLTDIDHLIPKASAELLMGTEFDTRSFMTFPRINFSDGSEYKPHPNSYLMTKKRYWEIGGYDETFAGNYGTDGMWRRRCEEKAAHVYLLGCPLARVDRKDIPDASTKPEVLNRKEGRDPEVLDDIREYKRLQGVGVQTLKLPWKRVL